MMEISTTVLVFAIEYMVGITFALGLILFLYQRRKKKRITAVSQLVAQIKKQSEVRTSETGSFLKDIYQLEDDELKKAIDAIDKGEKQFFQKLINSYLTHDAEIITAMDASVAELIDIYKALKPKAEVVENLPKSERELLAKQIDELTVNNDKLKEELGITKETMGNMIAEFGNMFGGGSDHELANFEVVEKVGVSTEESTNDD